MERVRNFTEVHVANFADQQREERYPDPEGDFACTDARHILEIAMGGVEPPEIDNEPPRIAVWRSNLVVLSQRFNLYLVACLDKIHVTVPRDLKQTIPAIPDLVVILPKSKDAVRVGGHISKDLPHCVNHITVGNLGQFEILLIACDDGDVLAFYTHQLRNEIKALTHSDGTAPVSHSEPFFHQNVGASAWGIAIHEHSRLIAVSSNAREITIFAHGYAVADPEDAITELSDDSEEDTCLGGHVFLTLEAFPVMMMFGSSTHVRDRHLGNYRIVFNLGNRGHNIPSIDFASDASGNAHAVLAADIRGNLWYFDIWENNLHDPTPMGENTDIPRQMGWGVLSLPLQDFKVVSSPREGLGVKSLENAMSLDDIQNSRCLNITQTIKSVKHASEWHPDWQYGLQGPPGPAQFGGKDSSSTSVSALINEDDQDEGNPGRRFPLYKNVKRAWAEIKNGSNPSANVEDGFGQEDSSKVMNFEDEFRQFEREALRVLLTVPKSLLPEFKHWKELEEWMTAFKSLQEKGLTPLVATDSLLPTSETPQYYLPDHSAILRTYTHDIELLPPTKGDLMFRTVCRKVLRQKLTDDVANLHHFNRLNMLASIPELSLVLVASQIGRVSLLTLTRLEERFSPQGPVVMFRLDLILPFKEDEDKARPPCPLLGMAVSPLQTDEFGYERDRGRDEGVKWPRRWRLMLHYYDHTILSYELGRDERDDMLEVI